MADICGPNSVWEVTDDPSIPRFRWLPMCDNNMMRTCDAIHAAFWWCSPQEIDDA